MTSIWLVLQDISEPAAAALLAPLEGFFPVPCKQVMESQGFSADAQHYLAGIKGDQLDEGYLFRCSLQDQEICLTLVRKLPALFSAWVPHSSLGITQLSTGPSMLVDFIENEPIFSLGHGAPGQLGLRGCLCFSPSGQFVCDGAGLPSIFCLKTGALLWKLAPDAGAIEQKLAAALTVGYCSYKAWLPSGRGLIFMDSQSASTALHLLMFS